MEEPFIHEFDEDPPASCATFFVLGLLVILLFTYGGILIYSIIIGS